MHLAITRRAPLDTPDGINISIFSLGDALAARGHRVTFVSATQSDPAKLREIYGLATEPQLVALSQRHGWDGSYRRLMTPWLLRGRRAIARLQPDYVIINGALPFPLPARSSVVAHDLEARMAGRIRVLYKRATYRFATHVVATCSEIRDLLAREIRMPASRIEVIPTCFDLRGYRGLPVDERERAILHMGTVDYKNPLATVSAFAALRTEARLYITGKPDASLKAAVEALPGPIRERVELLGFVSATELRDLLGRVRIVAVPSRYSVPVASPSVIEAFASSTPVVAGSSISRDVLVDGVSGHAVQDAEPGEMARRMDELLVDDARWTTFSQAALAAAAPFSADAVADGYLRLARSSGEAGAR